MKKIEECRGCDFCTRYGLPILPVRPAIISQRDKLPVIPEDIQVSVKAQGEIAYTLRLLRSGYLNIWDEFSGEWINYYVTTEGYYYPLPSDGSVPDSVSSGEMKPCINHPDEIAKASLITLPVLPPPMKNGIFWFSWSEVKWTEKIRKKFEDPGFRKQHMQRFDLDKWINNHQESQALPLKDLDKNIAEFNRHARLSQLRLWSSTLDKSVALAYKIKSKLTPVASGKNIEDIVNKEFNSDGAILVLQDPTAILKDISTLIKYELEADVYKKEDIAREFQLYSAITSLREGMKTQFERSYIADAIGKDDFVRSVDNEHPEGDITYKSPENTPDSDSLLYRKSVMKKYEKDNWKKYEKYYDQNKIDNFKVKFDEMFNEYNERIIIPRVQLYLDWFRSPELLNYFNNNFDRGDLFSGMAYTSVVSYCVTNMMDKKSALDYFSELLLKSFTDSTNIIGRALALNNDILIKKISDASNSNTNLIALPWVGLIDATKEIVHNADLAARSIIGIYLANISGAIIKSVNKILNSDAVFDFVVAMGAFQNKAIIRIQKKEQYKYFVKHVREILMEIGNQGVKPNPDAVERLVKVEVKRFEALGFPLLDEKTQNYLIAIDPGNAAEINRFPKEKKEVALSKMLISPIEERTKNITTWRTKITSGAGKTLTIVGAGILSTILQTVAVLSSADFGNKKTLSDDQNEEMSRFLAGTAGILGGVFGTIEAGIKGFLEVNNSLSIRAFDSLKAFKTFSSVAAKGLGLFAGAIAVAFDIYHMIDEIVKGKNSGLVLAYGTSAASGVWLIYVLFASSLTPWGIVLTILAVFFVLGSAIYIAVTGQDNIQKWLERCMWRKVPEVPLDQKSISEKTPDNDMPAIYPDMWIEIHEFKIALEEY